MGARGGLSHRVQLHHRRAARRFSSIHFEAWAGWYLYRLSPSTARGLYGLLTMSIADKAVALSGKLFGGK